MSSGDLFIRHYRLERSGVAPGVLAALLSPEDVPDALIRVLDLTTDFEREPWDYDEVTVLIDLVKRFPPSDVPRGSGHGPERIAQRVVGTLLASGPFWRCYVAFAQRIPDYQLIPFLSSCVHPRRVSRACVVIERDAVRHQITDVARLRILLASPYAHRADDHLLASIVRAVIPTLDDLVGLAPLLSAKCAAEVIFSLLKDPPIIPSRALLRAFVTAHPDLWVHLFKRDSHYPQYPREYRRLLFHVPGFAPAVLALGALSVTHSHDVYHPAYPALTKVLERCDPAVRLCLENPSASLAEALQAAHRLVAV